VIQCGDKGCFVIDCDKNAGLPVGDDVRVSSYCGGNYG
jgi:hypothetical protein